MIGKHRNGTLIVVAIESIALILQSDFRFWGFDTKLPIFHRSVPCGVGQRTTLQKQIHPRGQSPVPQILGAVVREAEKKQRVRVVILRQPDRKLLALPRSRKILPSVSKTTKARLFPFQKLRLGLVAYTIPLCELSRLELKNTK
jgi:hypothetical protein